MKSAKTPAPARLATLDTFRGIAILLVLFRHLPRCPVEQSVFLNRITTLIGRGGWIGVDLFFVLSGFLVSGLIFREYQKSNSFNIKRFLIRRGFRIYPGLWLLLAATAIVQLLSGENLSIQSYATEFFFLTNYIRQWTLWGPTWSLAIEEHFYLLLALLIFVLTKWKKANSNPFIKLPHLIWLVSIGCLGLRFITAKFQPTFQLTPHFMATHLRIDSLFFGVLLSYLYHLRKDVFEHLMKIPRIFYFSFGVILLLQPFRTELSEEFFIYTVGFTYYYLGAGALLLACLQGSLPFPNISKFLGFIGKSSYAIYLWHEPWLRWVADPLWNKTNGSIHWIFYMITYFTGACLIGFLITKFFEEPILRLRDARFPDREPLRN